jgi:hypothetical protein
MSTSQTPWPDDRGPQPARPFRRRGSVAIGAVVSLIAALVAVGVATSDSGPFSDAFDGGANKAPVVEQGGVARGGVAGQEDTVADLLKRRAAALVEKDRSKFLATVNPADAALRREQATWFDNLTAVPLTSWSYKMSSHENDKLPAAAVARAATAGIDSFSTFVDVALRITGYDNAPSTHDEVYTFTPREGRWYVSGRWVAPGRGNEQLWDVGKVHAPNPSRRVEIASIAVMPYAGATRP